MPKKNNRDNLCVTKEDQVRIVEELVQSSCLSNEFYLMLVLSAGVVTFGLILNNVPIIIGGMLITPLLTPVLTSALGIVIVDYNLIFRSLKTILRSIAIVLGISIIITFFFPPDNFEPEITTRLISGFPHFLVAFMAGLAATFAWSKKRLSAMLPGVAIAVSLLPPLSVIGIALVSINVAMLRASILTFLFNLFGIILGSMIIFSLLNFYQARKETIKAVEEEVKEKQQRKRIKKDIKSR
jgi:uncharacterized hydrophobic protein (TIGR00271 family)